MAKYAPSSLVFSLVTLAERFATHYFFEEGGVLSATGNYNPCCSYGVNLVADMKTRELEIEWTRRNPLENAGLTRG